MINIKKKLLIYSALLFSIIIFSGIKLNAELTSNSSSNLLIGNDKELFDLKVSVTEEWVIVYDYINGGSTHDLAADSNKNLYLLGSHQFLLNSTIVKYSASGVLQWDLTHNISKYWKYLSIFVDTFNNIYVTGYNISKTFDILLVKYNSNGNVIWNRTWGSPNEPDLAYDVAVNKRGDIYIAGYTESYEAIGVEFLLMKYNSTGDKQWNKTWGISKENMAQALCIDSHENIFVSGTINNTLVYVSNIDIALTYWNGTNGDLLWNTTWGSIEYEACNGMTIDAQDCVYIVGDSLFSSETFFDFFIVKYNNIGFPIWSKIWGSDYYDSGTSIAIDSNNNAYFVGTTPGYGAGLDDLYLAKFNPDGVQQWYTLWGRGETDHANSIFIDKSTDDIYIAGNSVSFSLNKEYNGFILKNPSFPTSSNTIYNYNYNIIEEEEDDSTDDESEAIPGYNILITLCVIFGAILIIINKKRFNR